MEYALHILVLTEIYIILSLSLNLVVGYTGLIALGHAAFSCVGAYTSALLALNYGLSPWVGILVGASAASIVGFVISYPCLRLSGDYLALATFGFGLIVYFIAKNWISVTKGPMGLPGIPGFQYFSLNISRTTLHLILGALLVLLTYFTIGRVVNSPFGRVLRAIREDEIAVESIGKNVRKYKVSVFVIGAFFAGISGSLYAHYFSFIDPSSFTLMESITILLMVVFGGMGSLSGSVLGATVLVLFPELLKFIGIPSSIAAPLRQMMFGFLLVVLMIKRPQGIFGKYRWK